MAIEQLVKPRKALNPAYLKVKPNRSDIELFKNQLILLLDQSNDKESEEFHKNLVSDFLKKTWYDPHHFINTKGRNDLVIHNGTKANTEVGVIIEAKKPTNKTEMPSKGNLNSKAFQELILYYLRERITHKNNAVRHLVVTNIYEWYIIDALHFDRLFAQNKKLVRDFEEFESGRLADTKTDFFYKNIAEPELEKAKDKIPFTFFDFREYEKPLRNADKADDAKLIALFKLLSPEHLLKLPFANDSNSLDKRFYAELLHLIGLEEKKDGGKKVIGRPKKENRNPGSLLENTINQLKTLDLVSRLDRPSQFGDTEEERLFAVGLELCITWVNRILFLKLLEAQLISYNKGSKNFGFLSIDKIGDYDELNSLFFGVLAKQTSEREEDLKLKFAHVPYLNSSLFEATEMEYKTIYISNLKDDRHLPLHSGTVLKDTNGKKLSGELSSLEYIFKFLDAYDFSSEGSEEIQEENKTLINASVLGLIFEKINGYKDGSFFTPGFITMYMCRETIRRAVAQKFAEAGYHKPSKDSEPLESSSLEFEDLYDLIDNREEANSLINSLKICDPAVGSGHFLVSALNEIIAVKNDLRILQDRNGKRLKEYSVTVVNDELVVTDEDGELFDYNPNNPESQRIQETLFHEKQTIIENCLFGVDINPNSVKICRLRLWIELLKSAYYRRTDLSGFQNLTGLRELETLPNIDINIKCGNSLVSRFTLDADLSQALKKSRFSIDSYRVAVDRYRNAQNKEEKREMERLIEAIKTDFRSEITKNDPKIKRKNALGGELYNLTMQTGLFAESEAEKKKREARIEKIEDELVKLEAEIEEIKANKIFENAFEWRFEFPEVLNKAGEFVGFDVVIGNPPYMRVQEIQKTQPLQKVYYESTYQNARAAYDLANIFFELAVNISSAKSFNSYIFPHKFFNSASSETFRDYLIRGQYIDKIAHFGANMIFEDADTYTCVAQFSKNSNEGFFFQRFPYKSEFQKLMLEKEKYVFTTYNQLNEASVLYGDNVWIFFDHTMESKIFKKIYDDSILLEDVLEGIFVGLQTSKDDLYVLDCLDEEKFMFKVPVSGKEYEFEKELFKPFLMGKDVQRYSNLKTNKYVFFPYKFSNGQAEIIELDEIKEKYPTTFQYLIDHEKLFKSRESGKAEKMKNWFGYIYPKNLNKFEQLKLTSMEICSIHPNVTLNTSNLYHTTKAYSWVKKEDTLESYEYLLSIANSKLLWWFLKLTGDTLQGDARTLKTNYLNPFPIPENPNPMIEKQIEKKVKEVLELKKQSNEINTKRLEEEIDGLVYELYGLSEEEIRIVERGEG